MERRRIALFDVDGTLTEPRKVVTAEMKDFLQQLRKVVPVALVGGSDLAKQIEQMGEDVLQSFDYVFSENGLVAYKSGKLLAVESLKRKLGDATINEFIKFTLKMISELDIPVMRGTFIEFRNGMFNVSPIGRNCSQEEREAFESYDKEHKVRATMIARLEERFGHLDLKYSIGGQISFDVFPRGWDKTFCLQFIQNDFDEIHFFGDKTSPGGNDYEIYVDSRVIGHSVTSPQHTMQVVGELFLNK